MSLSGFMLVLLHPTFFRNFSYNNYNIDLGTQKIRFYIGKRFDVNKKKKL